MVLGKLLLILASAPAFAKDVENPKFFSYTSSQPLAEFIQFSFGWFRTLDISQKEAYYSSIAHAVMYADNGEKVEWYQSDASGYTVPVVTWPTGSGYCRRMYIQAIAYNTVKTMQRTACFENASSDWHWIRE